MNRIISCAKKKLDTLRQRLTGLVNGAERSSLDLSIRQHHLDNLQLHSIPDNRVDLDRPTKHALLESFRRFHFNAFIRSGHREAVKQRSFQRETYSEVVCKKARLVSLPAHPNGSPCACYLSRGRVPAPGCRGLSLLTSGAGLAVRTKRLHRC